MLTVNAVSLWTVPRMESRMRGNGAPCHHGRNCHQRWPEFRVNDSEANNSPRPERARGQDMLVKRGTAEDVYAVVLQRLSDTAKTGLFESQSPGVEPHTRRQHI